MGTVQYEGFLQPWFPHNGLDPKPAILESREPIVRQWRQLLASPTLPSQPAIQVHLHNFRNLKLPLRDITSKPHNSYLKKQRAQKNVLQRRTHF